MIHIEYGEVSEPEGTYSVSALIIKLFGFAFVIAFGRMVK